MAACSPTLTHCESVFGIMTPSSDWSASKMTTSSQVVTSQEAQDVMETIGVMFLFRQAYRLQLSDVLPPSPPSLKSTSREVANMNTLIVEQWSSTV